jgi:ParB/RepB/Spo0J family partition protein
MQELPWIPTADFEFDPDQPRKSVNQTEILALGQNMVRNGQQIPVISYPVGGKQRLIDGARRLLAAKSAGIEQLLALVLPEKPDNTRLRLVQMSIEAHKVGLTPWERSCFLSSIKEENGWSVSELAEALDMKQPLVSKLLSHQRLAKPLQELLHAGKLDTEKAFIISQEPIAERQCEMARLYAHLPRERLRQKLRPNEPQEAKATRAKFWLAGGVSVTVQGRALTLSGTIDGLLATVRELKRTQSKNGDIAAAQKAMRKKAGDNHVQLADRSVLAR